MARRIASQDALVIGGSADFHHSEDAGGRDSGPGEAAGSLLRPVHQAISSPPPMNQTWRGLQSAPRCATRRPRRSSRSRRSRADCDRVKRVEAVGHVCHEDMKSFLFDPGQCFPAPPSVSRRLRQSAHSRNNAAGGGCGDSAPEAPHMLADQGDRHQERDEARVCVNRRPYWSSVSRVSVRRAATIRPRSR